MPDPTGRVSHLPNFHRGESWKQPCRVATTANVTIATALNAGDTIDGVVLAALDRVLVKDQTAGAENGIYYAGVTPARDYDMDQDGATTVTASEVMGALVYVIAGTANAGKLYRNTNTTAPTLGTTALTFAEIVEPGWTSISPAQITANTDNYNPTGLSTADIIRVSTDASRNLTGITAPAAVNRHVILANIGAFDLVLKHDVTSTAANRFYCPNNTDMTLQQNSAALLAYDLTSLRWRIIGGTGGGAAFATPAIVLGTAAAAGAATTVIRSDSTIAAFDATVPVTQAFGDAAATGSIAFAARRDHKHGMPASATGALFASITAASAAIANTETVVVSGTIGAGTLVVGQSFRIRAAGVGTTGAAPGNDTFRIRIGTTTLTGTIPTSIAIAANAAVTAQPFNFEALVTIRTITAAGTVIGECIVEGDNVVSGLFTLLQAISATTATVAVDSTVANLLELTFQSGAATSSCTFHIATIENLSGSSTVATDAIWDVAGDLAVGTGANTAARLALGAAGGAVSRINGAVAWNSGTVNPTGATGDRFWRTDLGQEIYYDGTRWLTTQLFAMQFLPTDSSLYPLTTGRTPYGRAGTLAGTLAIYLTSWFQSWYVATTNSGANYWTFALVEGDAGGAIASFTTAAGAADTWSQTVIAINALAPSGKFSLQVNATKSGTPGSSYPVGTLMYRMVIT